MFYIVAPFVATGLLVFLFFSSTKRQEWAKEQNKDEIHKGNVQLHEYNKELRPNRKVGHINVWSIDRSQLEQQLLELESSLYNELD